MHRLAHLFLVLAAVAAPACNRTEKPVNKPASDPAALRAQPPANAGTRPTDGRHTSRLDERQIAVLAGGCFWGMEELLRKLPGVIETTVGYAGGAMRDPSYHDVSSGRTGHAESVRVVFDPEKLSYERLLLYFFTIHDPTTRNRQENDVGTQYRSAIFVQDEAQRRIADKVIRTVNASGDWQTPIATEIIGGGAFYPAEPFHQDYLQKHPDGYSCHYERDVSYY